MESGEAPPADVDWIRLVGMKGTMECGKRRGKREVVDVRLFTAFLSLRRTVRQGS